MEIPKTPAGFRNRPDTHWDEEDRLVLDAPLVYVDERGQTWVIPAGFKTDLASIPAWVPGLVRVFFGSALQNADAAILHDWLYATGTLSRSEADALFREALAHSGEHWFGRELLWAGVRVGGWVAWRAHRRA